MHGSMEEWKQEVGSCVLPGRFLSSPALTRTLPNTLPLHGGMYLPFLITAFGPLVDPQECSKVTENCNLIYIQPETIPANVDFVHPKRDRVLARLRETEFLMKSAVQAFRSKKRQYMR